LKGVASRIVGRGRLLRSLRALVRRVDRFGQHRVSTHEELRWANVLADHLDRAFLAALTEEARVSLAHADRRAGVSQKSQPGTGTEGGRTHHAV
jgi:hypothetical protein